MKISQDVCDNRIYKATRVNKSGYDDVISSIFHRFDLSENTGEIGVEIENRRIEHEPSKMIASVTQAELYTAILRR